MKTYSVLLLYPDYMADDYGQDTFYTSVQAEIPARAVALCQQEAMASNGDDDNDPEDFYPLLVIEGDHPALRID